LLRKKYLVALRAILKGLSLKPSSPQVHERIIRFFHAVSLEENLNPDIIEPIEIHKKEILKGSSLHEFNEHFFKTNNQTVAGRYAYYQSAILLNPEVKSKMVKLILDPTDTEYGVKTCIKIYDYLSKEFPDSLVEYKEYCHKIYPYSTFFGAETTCANISPGYVHNKPENEE